MNNEKVGSFLAELRQEKNLKQTDVAALCNVTFQAVSQWETGKTLPDIETLKNLSDIYNITINEILEGKRNIVEEVVQEAQKEILYDDQKSYVKSKIMVSIIIAILTFTLIITSLFGGSLQLMLLPALIISLYHIIHFIMNKDDLSFYLKNNKSNKGLLISSKIFLIISVVIFVIGIANGSLLIYGFLQPFFYVGLILNFNSMNKLIDQFR